jgi:ABC-2 type transport system permease protein
VTEPTTPDARLLDRSLARVGERRGVSTSMLALGRHTARRILGLRRPLRYKVLPVAFAGIAFLPSVAFLGLAALLPGQLANEVLPTPVDFYASILFAVILFTALAGPQVLCPDRRHRTLGLFLASPLDRTTYLVANAAALMGVLLVVTIGPPLVGQIGFALLDVPGPALPLVLVRVLLSGMVLAVLYGMVGLAGASLTDRRGFASAGIFLALVGLTVVTEVLREALDLSDWVGILDVANFGMVLVERIHGVGGRGMGDVPTLVLVFGAVAWVGGLAAIVQWRYRRLAVVR